MNLGTDGSVTLPTAPAQRGTTTTPPRYAAHDGPRYAEHDVQRYAALDGLRAFAAFAVLLTHAGDAAGLPGKVTNIFGFAFPTGVAIQQLNLGVEIFFVISAFLVYRPFASANIGQRVHPEPIRFLWKRAWRIYPAYWVALGIIVPLFALRTLPNTETALAHGLLTYGYDPLRWNGGGVGLKQSWTLVIEISFYCFIPMWAWCIRSVGRWIQPLRAEVLGACALIAVSPVFMLATRQHNVWTPFRVLPPYLSAFGFGMLFAIAVVWRSSRPDSPRVFDLIERFAWLSWIGALAVFIVVVHNVDLSVFTMLNPASSHQTIERMMHTVVAALVVAPIALTLRPNTAMRAVLANRVVARIGMWSYGFYLWHYTFVDYMHDHHFDSRSTYFFGKIVIVATAGATLLGAASWYGIERPMLRLSEGAWRRPRWLQWRRPSFYWGLGSITAAALAWRVGYVVANIGRLRLSGDAFYYHTQANDIAQGRWFIDPSQFAWYGRVTPSAGHPPAYLLYLASVSKWIGNSELTHRLASTLLGAATVFAVGVLARRLFNDDRVGWLAAGFAAIYAHLWINDEMLMSETMAQLWAVIAFIAVYQFWRKPGMRTAAWMGAAIGLAAMSRAEYATLFPLLVIPLVLLTRSLTLRQRIKVGVVSCLVGGAIMAPWILYNAGRFQHPVAMSNGIGSVLMVANCDRTYGHAPVAPHEDPDAYLGYWSVGCAIDAGFTALQKGDESEKEVEWRKVGVDYIKGHLGEQPKVVALRVARMWDIGYIGQNIHPFNADLEGRGGWPSMLATIQYIVFVPFAIHGLILLRRRKTPILPYLAVAGTITFTAASTFGITRYRAPIDALIPVIAAGAMVWRWDRSRASRRGEDASDASPVPAK